MAITAIGIDAVTVNPSFNARYTVEDPKRIPKRQPNKIDFTVNSAMFASGATYGLNNLFSFIRVRFYERSFGAMKTL